MSTLIVSAPEDGALALAQALGAIKHCRWLPMAGADEQALSEADALVLVLPDYYTHGCWQMKHWLSRYIDLLPGKLCSCIVLATPGSGSELALRTIVSQFLAGQCPVYLCGVLCSDGRIRSGGGGELLGPGLSPGEFIRKLHDPFLLGQALFPLD